MIAISYRREDSLPTAGRLYDRLQAKFGKKNVFMDFDSIPPGVDFREQIRQMIERSNVVIAIIGPHWFGEQSDASRRIDDPADFVRLEIAYALKRGIPIIPALVNNTPMPSSEKLPEEIKDLAFRNAVTLDTGIDFHHHVDRLLAGIRKAMAVAPQLGERQEVREPIQGAAYTLRSLRKIFISTAAILLAVAALTIWLLMGHRHEQESNATSQSVGAESPRPAKAESSVSPTEAASPASLPSPVGVGTYGARVYVATGDLVDFDSGYLAIRQDGELWYFARTPSTVVTGDLKSGNPVSVSYYMVTPDMYSDFKTYSVTGTILEDNNVMVAVKATENSLLKRKPDDLKNHRWEIAHQDSRAFGPAGKDVMLIYKMIALQVTTR